jgi:predicted O-methyltransferase YrrM
VAENQCEKACNSLLNTGSKEKPMEKWENNDLYVIANLIEEDMILEKTLEASRENDIPEWEVSSAQGKFLYLLAKMKGARRILEIGTLGGYSTIWLAKALADGGIVISLENNQNYADAALKNIEFAGFLDKIEILKGEAVDLLNGMINRQEAPFDMIFIDADKPNYSLYLELCLHLSKSGTVIYADNVVRAGELCNANNPDPNVKGVREFIENLGKSTKLESTALQTVGIKGYDGFAISVVK